MRMPPRFAEVIKQARQVRRLTLRRPADHVMKEDATPISPQYLLDIEVHHCGPAPDILCELARVLELDYTTLLAVSGGADVVVREYLQPHPEAEAAFIKLFRAAQQRGFHDGDQLRQRTARGREGRSSLCAGLLTAYQEPATLHGASLAA
jgi:hypothetical protein